MSGRSLKQRLMFGYFLVTRPMTLGVRGVAFDAETGCCWSSTATSPAGISPAAASRPARPASVRWPARWRRRPASPSTGRWRCTGCFITLNQSPRDHVAVYVTRSFRVLGERAPDREILAARFFALDALPEDTTRATRARLAEICDGRPLSPTW